jgi:hypothetical protein
MDDSDSCHGACIGKPRPPHQPTRRELCDRLVNTVYDRTLYKNLTPSTNLNAAVDTLSQYFHAHDLDAMFRRRFDEAYDNDTLILHLYLLEATLDGPMFFFVYFQNFGRSPGSALACTQTHNTE